MIKLTPPLSKRQPNTTRPAQIITLLALISLLSGACGSDDAPPPPDYESETLWAPVRLDQATALGHTAAPIAADAQTPAGDIAFDDVTDEVGLSQAIGGGNQHGVGVAFVDLNGDGWPDIFIANGRSNLSEDRFPSLYYQNNGDGTFEDATAATGLDTLVEGSDLYSVAAADYDSDGDIDLYLGAQPRDILLRNNGDGSFEDVTDAAKAGGPNSDPGLVADGRSKVVSFGDYDSDGHPDIVSASSTLPGSGAYLLRNLGDGTFEDISAASGVQIGSTGNPCAVMWSDYDNDTDVDLWIWNDRGNHILLRNEAGERFTDITRQADGVTITNPMGIDGADIDHDGDLDYYVSNIRTNPLLLNRGDGTFQNIGGASGTNVDFGWGVGFEDFNADTWADLFVAQEDNLPYFTFVNLGLNPPRFGAYPLDHPPVIDDFAANNVAVAFADYDSDGRVDVLTAGTDGRRVNLFRNVTDIGTHRWLEVRVARAPGTQQAGGVGARVAVKTGDLVQFRDITGGSSRASQNQLSVRFGLGQYSGAEWVIAQWPDGRQLAATGVEGNQVLTLTPTE